MHSQPEAVYVLGDPPNYEPDEEASVATYAKRHGMTGPEAFYDLLTEGDGSTLLLFYLDGYSKKNFDYMAGLMRHPLTCNGLSDAGAHVGAVSDAHMPSWNLAFWGRDRTRGERVELETIVHKQTGANAALYGLTDRGVLEAGKRADISVIDFDRLSSEAPYLVYDLPENAKRYMQRSAGLRRDDLRRRGSSSRTTRSPAPCRDGSSAAARLRRSGVSVISPSGPRRYWPLSVCRCAGLLAGIPGAAERRGWPTASGCASRQPRRQPAAGSAASPVGRWRTR